MDEEVDWGVEEDEFDPWTATTGSTQERGTGQPDSAKAVASQEPTGEERESRADQFTMIFPGFWSDFPILANLFSGFDSPIYSGTSYQI